MGTPVRTSGARRAAIAISVTMLVLALGGVPAAGSGSHVERPSARASRFFTRFDAASDDGTKVFFSTYDGLVPADTDGIQDVYERSGGTTALLSTGSINGNGEHLAWFNSASSDGTKVYFSTEERLVPADTDHAEDIYLRSGGTTTLISGGAVDGSGPHYALFSGASADGSRVYFGTHERMVAADTDTAVDVYRHSGGVNTRISAGAINGNGDSPLFDAWFAGESSDGTKAWFSTRERLVAADTDSQDDVYQRSGGTTSLISKGAVNGNGPFDAGIGGASDDGLTVYFESEERLVAADTDAEWDVYHRSGGVTTLVSKGAVNGNGAFDVYALGSSSDGTRYRFSTYEPLVAADTDTALDIYERSPGTTTLISVGEVNGNGESNAVLLDVSRDGSRFYFATPEPLVAADTDSAYDLYVRSGGTTTLVSAGEVHGNGPFHVGFAMTASSDGGSVFFVTSERLTVDDTDHSQDIYERSRGVTKRVSIGTANDNGAFRPKLDGASSDGTRVWFNTRESLTASDGDDGGDVYERFAGTTREVSRGP